MPELLSNSTLHHGDQPHWQETAQHLHVGEEVYGANQPRG